MRSRVIRCVNRPTLMTEGGRANVMCPSNDSVRMAVKIQLEIRSWHIDAVNAITGSIWIYVSSWVHSDNRIVNSTFQIQTCLYIAHILWQADRHFRVSRIRSLRRSRRPLKAIISWHLYVIIPTAVSLKSHDHWRRHCCGSAVTLAVHSPRAQNDLIATHVETH